MLNYIQNRATDVVLNWLTEQTYADLLQNKTH